MTLSMMFSGAWVAFSGMRRLALGRPRVVAAAVKQLIDANAEANVLVFDVQSSEPVEIDLRGSIEDVLGRLPPDAEPAAGPETGPASAPSVARAPGRPKLGVVAREVTLLPRHWEWLSAQPGGASVALRKVVEQGLRASAEADRRRLAQESTYRFLNAIAGNLPCFEEAVRALFAGDGEHFAEQMADWPEDIREHALLLAHGGDEAAAGA